MIAVVDSGGANVSSVLFALERLGVAPVFTADPDVIAKASHVVLPGVGAAAGAMDKLRERGLCDCLKTLRQPVMGICLGMQLLFAHSQEGQADCLGLIPATVTKFDDSTLTVPHMGWNAVRQVKPSPLFAGVANESYVYFVHSFFAPLGVWTLGETDYGQAFSSVVQKDNFFGCQFHPERSGADGAKILENFTRL